MFRGGFEPPSGEERGALRMFLFLWFVVIVLIVAAIDRAAAHSFYPWECCSDQDCWPTGEGEKEPDPKFTREGWKLHDGTVIPHNMTRPSPDGRFHVCRHGGTVAGSIIRPADKPPCLWVPQGGV